MEEFITGAPLGPRVIEVKPQNDYKLLLRFDNGEKRILDAAKLLDKKSFRPLANPAFSLWRR